MMGLFGNLRHLVTGGSPLTETTAFAPVPVAAAAPSPAPANPAADLSDAASDARVAELEGEAKAADVAFEAARRVATLDPTPANTAARFAAAQHVQTCTDRLALGRSLRDEARRLRAEAKTQREAEEHAAKVATATEASALPRFVANARPHAAGVVAALLEAKAHLDRIGDLLAESNGHAAVAGVPPISPSESVAACFLEAAMREGSYAHELGVQALRSACNSPALGGVLAVLVHGLSRGGWARVPSNGTCTEEQTARLLASRTPNDHSRACNEATRAGRTHEEEHRALNGMRHPPVRRRGLARSSDDIDIAARMGLAPVAASTPAVMFNEEDLREWSADR